MLVIRPDLPLYDIKIYSHLLKTVLCTYLKQLLQNNTENG